MPFNARVPNRGIIGAGGRMKRKASKPRADILYLFIVKFEGPDRAFAVEAYNYEQARSRARLMSGGIWGQRSTISEVVKLREVRR